MINQQELIEDVLRDLPLAARAYTRSSDFGLLWIPERILQCSFFLNYHQKYTMTCEYRVTRIFDDAKKLDSNCIEEFGGQAVDLVVYEGDRKKEEQKVAAIVEYKKGYLDIWKDIGRSKKILKLLGLDHDTIAIICAVVANDWYEKHEPEVKECLEKYEYTLKAPVDFDIEFESQTSMKCKALAAFMIVPAPYKNLAQPLFPGS